MIKGCHFYDNPSILLCKQKDIYIDAYSCYAFMVKTTIIWLFCCFTPYLFADQLQKTNGLGILSHENKGCPINSVCSKTSGKKLQQWEKALKRITSKNIIKELIKFKNKNGLPIQFLTRKKAQKALDPILWNSRCKFHNPKNPNNDILKGMQFFKNLPDSELTVLTPVRLYDGIKKIDYKIPYGDQVYFIKNKKLIVLKDYDDFYYQLALGADRSMTVVNHPSSLINMALDKRVTQIKCPAEMDFDSTYFSKIYCQKVLDLDTNDLRIIQYPWTCP